MYYKQSGSFRMFEVHQDSINRAKQVFKAFKGVFWLSCWLCILVSLYTLLYKLNTDLTFQLDAMVCTSWGVLSWINASGIQPSRKYTSYKVYNLFSWLEVVLKLYLLYLILQTGMSALFVSHALIIGLMFQNIFVHIMYDVIQFSCWMYHSMALDELIPIHRLQTQPRFNL